MRLTLILALVFAVSFTYLTASIIVRLLGAN